MYEYMLMAILIFLIILAVVSITYKYLSRSQYWKGRSEGWRACEKMAMERAEEHGYDMGKFWPDIFQ